MDVKIVLQYDNVKHLYVLKMNETLTVNIKNICKQFNLPNYKDYGLKLLETNDGTIVNHYVYDDNYETLGNGFKLLLTDSLERKIAIIMDSIKCGNETHITALSESCDDLAFIKELIKQERHIDLLNIMAEDGVKSVEFFAYAKVLLTILRKKLIVNIDTKLLIKMTNIIHEGVPEKTLIAVLALSSQILRMKSSVYKEAKEELLQYLQLDDLYKCIKIKTDNLSATSLNNLRLNALVLINTIARLLKGQMQMQFLLKMNAIDNKGLIYTYCIENAEIVDKEMAKEINVYQTYAMSILKEKLTYVNREQTLIDDSNWKRYSVLSINDTDSIIEQQETIMFGNARDFDSNNARMSLASITSFESDATYLSVPLELASNKILLLTNECIDYFERNHLRSYREATADKMVGVEFLYVAERISKALTKIFRIGYPPVASDFFYPIFFKKSICSFFFHELFARAFTLFLRLKREMNATTKDDFEVVFKVFEYQLALILRQRPHDYKELMQHIKNSSYQTIANKMQKELELEFAYVLQHNPGVICTIPKITQNNEELIFEQRMNVLKRGELFPKFSHKKNANIFIKLNESLSVFTWGDWDATYKKIDNPIIFNIKDIQYLIVGQACPHVKNNTVSKYEQHLAFSLQLRDDTVINCLAKELLTAHHWTDGISLLIGLKDRSSTYKKDLETLNEMDLHLNMIELQNLRIPNKAPYIPPEPQTLPNF